MITNDIEITNQSVDNFLRPMETTEWQPRRYPRIRGNASIRPRSERLIEPVRSYISKEREKLGRDCGITRCLARVTGRLWPSRYPILIPSRKTSNPRTLEPTSFSLLLFLSFIGARELEIIAPPNKRWTSIHYLVFLIFEIDGWRASRGRSSRVLARGSSGGKSHVTGGDLLVRLAIVAWRSRILATSYYEFGRITWKREEYTSNISRSVAFNR